MYVQRYRQCWLKYDNPDGVFPQAKNSQDKQTGWISGTTGEETLFGTCAIILSQPGRTWNAAMLISLPNCVSVLHVMWHDSVAQPSPKPWRMLDSYWMHYIRRDCHWVCMILSSAHLPAIFMMGWPSPIVSRRRPRHRSRLDIQWLPLQEHVDWNSWWYPLLIQGASALV